jgi:(S)-ureidoglycine aminohydrolase
MNPINGHAGETRSVLHRKYLLHTPDAFVRTPMPEITNGVAIIHAAPRLGAAFLQYTAEIETGGSLAPVQTQRFVWILSGEITLELQAESHLLSPGAYAYLPAGSDAAITAKSAATLAVIEKTYEPLPGVAAPAAFVGREEAIAAVALGGDTQLMVRSLLPSTPACDFAVNTMTYVPGAALAQVEIHVMEHGLVMLEGAGTQLLGDLRYETQAGDFIWMAPFCPQWFVATSEVPAKYLIYKDWNRRPKL